MATRTSTVNHTAGPLFDGSVLNEACAASVPPSLGHRYSSFYRALSALREEFHRIGRFDDANAKLDELCKLLVLRTLDARHPLPNGSSRLSREALEETAFRETGDRTRLAAALHATFEDIANRFPREMAGFGAKPTLNLQPDDDEFAAATLPLLEALPGPEVHLDSKWSFDALNEAFGHFVQDSFRNRKEDAQYMTPPEVVASVVDMAIHDLVEDPERVSCRPMVVGDPTCGVGSFLAAFYRRASAVKLGGRPLAERLRLFGQDKVERMSRLALVNLSVFADADADIRTGNSILPLTGLDHLAGQFDLILTNPPFGASFGTTELLAGGTSAHLPAIFSLARTGALPRKVDSEYILLDRELALLRPGGSLLMVVPDHVVSGSGFSEEFRLELERRYELRAVVDLPTETFAQAGTRTKTSVIYLRKPARSGETRRSHVFMGCADELGFKVVSRTGATVKRVIGRNDMAEISAAYARFASSPSPAEPLVCLQSRPSVSAVVPASMINSRWTAGFYRDERLRAIRVVPGDRRRCALTSLTELVDIDVDETERVFRDDVNRCISVLHVREDGSIDLAAVADYSPTTACVRCRAGDILLSKINPRIVRIAVVPATAHRLGCSAEFAVLRPRPSTLSAWELSLLLRSQSVQRQIQSLTSGTSSSHNRIKARDLEVVQIPVPPKRSAAAKQLVKLAAAYRDAIERGYESQAAINVAFSGVDSIAHQ